MKQQGDADRDHEGDWWRQLYDSSAGDVLDGDGGSDSVDERYASAASAVGIPPAPPARPTRDAEARSGTPRVRCPAPPPGSPPAFPPAVATGPDTAEPEPVSAGTQGAGAPPPHPDSGRWDDDPWSYDVLPPPRDTPDSTPLEGRPERASGAAAADPAEPPPTPVRRKAVTDPVDGNGPRWGDADGAGPTDEIPVRRRAFGPPAGSAPGAPAPGEVWRGGGTVFGQGPITWPEGDEEPPVAMELPPGWEAAEIAGPVHVGDGPPTYEAEPTAWPAADPEALDDLVPDTVLDGARYGVLTLRTVSVRGDSARFRGQQRRDALLTARFGTGDDALLLVAAASGERTAEEAHRAAQDACRWIAGAVGRSRIRLVEDIRAARRGSLKSGLHRLTDRCYGRLRARGEELGLADGAYTASLRCLLLPADPSCRIRLFFGVGGGGLFRIRDGVWRDLDPAAEEGFRFRASVGRPGDALLMCTGGLADPLRGEPALSERLTARWGSGEPPGLTAFLADARTRVKGYADDRTVAAVWDS